MSGLERTFVDLQRAVATLTKHKSSHTRRDRKPRVVVLHPVVLKLLAWIYRKQPGGRFVFVNARGDPWTRYSLACRFKRLRKRLGLPVTCKLYGLRHKFGTDAILNGVSLTMLAELMGHSRTETTLHYVHLQSEDLRGAIVQAVKRP